MRARPGPRRLRGLFTGCCALAFALVSIGTSGRAAEEGPPQPVVAETVPVPIPSTNDLLVLQTLQQIQEQLGSNRIAIQQNAKAIQESGLHSAEALTSGLQSVENALSAKQEVFLSRTAKELETMRGTSRLALGVACAVAGMAVLAMLIIAYYQWRMSRVWTRFTSAPPVPAALPKAAIASLGPGEGEPFPGSVIEEANRRLLGAMERLEKRIENLEQGFGLGAQPQPAVLPAGNGKTRANGAQPVVAEDPRITALLARGQGLMKENQLEAAVGVFDEVLSLNPVQGEALVKKGAALEKLKKLNEAFECYDRAIEADSSMTIAYLHKGGLCSRLERFKEALECYEKALQTHDEWHG